jgi:hypothetical protein
MQIFNHKKLATDRQPKNALIPLPTILELEWQAD